jgi:NAD(P)-dependent dehydrogenase (short-subunit alcohol dehydrogenase family)
MEVFVQLEGKVAVVTGGSRGIGRGIVEAFLAEGASVVFSGRSQEKGERALQELDAGERACFVQGDVLQKADIKRLVDAAIERYGQLDIMVNNAGGAGGFAPTAELSDEAWEQAIAWNLHSTFYGTKYALAHMIPRQSGRIINMSSVEGKHGKAGMVAYVASKHGINGLTKACAKEVGTLGITVNALAPGLILTDIVRESGAEAAKAMGLSFEQMVDFFAQESAIHRSNTVEEVAAVAVLLASDIGAGITGTIVSVDGGTAQY